MQQLLEAEGAAVGLSPGLEGLSFATDGKGDGGVDALVATHPDRPSDLIPGPWVFQAKTSLDLSKLKRELKSSGQARARKLLRAGAGYTLIVNAHLKAEEALPRLQKLLKEVVKQHVKCQVLAREHVARWLLQHPQLLSHVPGLSTIARHLRDHAQWDRELGTRLAWTPDEPRLAAVERLRGLPPARVCRVVGAPGVGKSRLVLEALRSRAAEVSYLPVFHDDVEALLARDAPIRGVLVVDECSTEQHERLTRLHASEVALITIGTDDDRRLNRRDDELFLEPMSDAAMRTLAERVMAAVDHGTRLELASLSGGYPKYFDLLLQAVAAAPDRPVSLARSDLHRMTNRFLASLGPLEVIRALAAAKWVDLSPGATDAEVLATSVESSEIELRRTIEALFKRGYAGKRGRLWYVTPPLLAEQLTIDFWGVDASRRFTKLIESGAENDLVERCMMRLEHGSADARALLVVLARDTDLLQHHLLSHQQFRLIQELAEHSPHEALAVTEALLRLRPELPWSEELGASLARIARNANCFDRAVNLLIERFNHAPEGAGSGYLRDLFPSNDALTMAAPSQRLAVIESLASSPAAQARTLSAELARVACSQNITFAAGGWDFKRPRLTRDEEADYRLRAAGVLARLLGDLDPAVRARGAAIATELIFEQVTHGFVDVAVALVRGLRAHGHALQPARRELNNLLQLQRRERLGADLGELVTLLGAESLQDRLEALLTWDFELRPDEAALDALVAELAAKPTEDVFRFLSQSGPRQRVGEALARFDPERRLMKWIKSSLRHEGASPYFAEAYLRAWPAELDATLDEWAAHPELSWPVLLMTVRQGSYEPRRVARIQRVINATTFSPSWLMLLSGYVDAPAEVRALLRPALERFPKEWLEAAVSGVPRLNPSEQALDELQDAWTAAFPEGDWLDSDWRHATKVLATQRGEFLRQFAFRELGRTHRFPKQLLDVAPALLCAWGEFTAAFDALSTEEQGAVSRALKTRAWGVGVPAVLAWIGGDARRRGLAAMMAPPVADHRDNLGAALLDAWPEDQAVGRVLHHNFHPREHAPGVFDPSADAAVKELSDLRKLAGSSRPGLSRWARGFVPEHEAILRQRREDEEGDKLGMRWSREPGQKISQAVYKLAEAQQGYFSAAQAKQVGCSAQLLRRYQETRKVVRVRRSVYRLGQFPAGEHEDLMVTSLWSGGRGVFSHTTALTLHQLSNVISERHELTLPSRDAGRRLKVPDGVLLHFADIPKRDRVAFGPLWATSVERTLSDCAAAGMSVELLREARADAVRKGLMS